MIRALLFVCVGVVGCTSSGSEDAGAELGAATGTFALRGKTGSLALLRIDRATPEQGAPARIVANAKVARYTGIDGSSVLKLLGANDRDGEGCTIAGRLGDLSMAHEARVELLSIGDISLRAGFLSQTLAPRLFPDLAGTASGWFYGGNADVPGDIDEYTLSAPGEHGVGRFDTSIAAPSEPLTLEVSGVSLEREGKLVRSRDAELTWEPEDVRDRIELEVYAGGSVLSCTLRDDGHFVLPQTKLASLDKDAHGSLVARRVRVTSTDMQGIESAYLRVASMRTLPLQIE